DEGRALHRRRRMDAGGELLAERGGHVRQPARQLRRKHRPRGALMRGDFFHTLVRRAIAAALLVCAAAAAEAASSLPLVEAVKGATRDGARTLLRQKANVNAAEADGTTALHWAVRSDDQELVQLLLAA